MHISQDLIHRGADKSLARPTSRFILFDGENTSFDTSLVIYIYKRQWADYTSKTNKKRCFC